MNLLEGGHTLCRVHVNVWFITIEIALLSMTNPRLSNSDIDAALVSEILATNDSMRSLVAPAAHHQQPAHSVQATYQETSAAEPPL